MHALTTYIAKPGETVFAAVPTYYNPGYYVHCKFFVEYCFHTTHQIFYHGIITELLDSPLSNLQKLSGGCLRLIHRKTHKLDILPISMPALFTNEQIMQYLQSLQAVYVIDLPAPFVAKDLESLHTIKTEIHSYFKGLAHITKVE